MHCIDKSMHRIVTILIVLLQLYLHNVESVPRPAAALQVQLHEIKISEQNNTDYVREIMRLAKSAEMRNYMQENVDACDNFFKFACGNWAQINPVDSGSSRETNFFERLTEAYNQKQLKVLQEAADDGADDDGGDSETDVKAKNFYAACIHLSELPKEGYTLKLWELVEEFGQMPVLNGNGAAWEEQDFDWLETIAKIQNKYGVDIILQLGIRQDFESKNVSKLFIGQAPLKLQTKSMYKHEAAKWYRENYKSEIAHNLEKYLNVAQERAVKTAEEILDFEVKLSNGIMDKRLGKTLKSMTKLRTIEEIQAAYEPTINFTQFITIALGHEFNATFYEYYLDYQVNLVRVLRETPKAQLANYIMYQLLSVFFYDAEASVAIREKVCLGKTKMFFAKVLDNIIFRKYNNKKTEHDINVIWEQIKSTFKAELQSDKLHWLTLTTRKLAIEKLDVMQLEINSYEAHNFSNEYATLAISNHDYVENIKQVLSFESRRILDMLYSPPRRAEAAVILSYTPAHIAIENLIKIPVSLLQPNYLWSAYYPHALKFGTLGYLVAHELIHGFDDMGRNFDASGLEKSWWDANSTLAFNERKNCFKRQYARYRYGGKYLPESELQSENIADNGAIQLAYTAYLNWVAATSERSGGGGEDVEKIYKMELLPNMKYSNKQLFFIGFAQYWCNDVNEHFKDKVSLVNIHAPAMYRVIGSLANFNEFSKEFQCASGTGMNPEQKCQIY